MIRKQREDDYNDVMLVKKYWEVAINKGNDNEFRTSRVLLESLEWVIRIVRISGVDGIITESVECYRMI